MATGRKAPKGARSRLTALEGTAYHEAGHAVAAFYLRRTGRLRRVTIVPDEKAGTLGHTQHWCTPAYWRKLDEGDWSAPVRLRLEEECIVLLAGGIAEKRATGRYNRVGARSDREKAADLALHACGDDRIASAFLKWLSLRAEGLVNVRWREIEAIAAALLRHKTLKGRSRISEIVDEALGLSRARRGAVAASTRRRLAS